MQDLLTVTGMVLKSEPIGEYDRRVVLLTKEKGKISCFAKGSRKPGNRLMASTMPFAFGEFKLYIGKSSYSINEAVIQFYFEELRNDYSLACLGMYFLELMDYFTRENNDELEFLKLLFQSIKALVSKKFDNRLIKCIFEIKSICINGEYPGVPSEKEYVESTIFTLNYIYNSSIEKLYTFKVSDSVLEELKEVSGKLIDRFVDRPLKSMELIDI